jgi:exosortase/archaeosortase family protein
MINLLKTISPLLWRVIVFICLFIILSGLIGPKIISGGILFRDGFAVYGGVGKAVLFGLVAFVLLLRSSAAKLTVHPWRPTLLGWMVASGIAFACAWVSVNQLLAGERTLSNLLVAHAGLLCSLIFAGIGCFGLKNIQLVWRQYTREIVSSVALGSMFYLFLMAVYALWQPLAQVVLYSVSGLLAISGLHAIVFPPHSLLFNEFGITIAESCSGIESIALFTSLYAIVGLLDWKRLHRRRYFLLFPIALAILFLLNIVRVYGLIMAGYYINPQLAFSLFHTYAGLLFFIAYSAVFWLISYKYLLKMDSKPSRGPKPPA